MNGSPNPSTASSPNTTFDVVAYYNRMVSSDPNKTPTIAAIETLITLLATTPLSTISETLALLTTHADKLLASQRNPIPLRSGAELFQRYLVSSFQQRPASLANSDFVSLKKSIIANSSLFVTRANEARLKIAQHALAFIKDNSTIITYGDSRCVTTLLAHAAEAGRYFNIVFVLPQTNMSSQVSASIAALRKLSIPTTTIPLHSLTYALSSLPPMPNPPIIIIGATAVLENGALISAIGAHQVGLAAKALALPLYVAVESYKFVRSFPLGQGKDDLAKLGVQQDVLNFSSEEKAESEPNYNIARDHDMIEITPPALITALVTEEGVMSANAVSEELIKLWF